MCTLFWIQYDFCQQAYSLYEMLPYFPVQLVLYSAHLRWRMISEGREEAGLYTFQKSAVTASFTKALQPTDQFPFNSQPMPNNPLHIWHCRLGLPSFSYHYVLILNLTWKCLIMRYTLCLP